MLRFLLGALLAALMLTGHAQAAPSGRVPTFDVMPSCRGAAVEDNANGADGATRTSVSACFNAEQKAREQLVQEWASFKASDRTQCSEMSRMGGDPTYTELLTCLEMMRDARQPSNGTAQFDQSRNASNSRVR